MHSLSQTRGAKVDDTICQRVFSCHLINTTAAFERKKRSYKPHIHVHTDSIPHQKAVYLPYDVSPRMKNCFSANSCCNSALTLAASGSKKSGNWRAICRRRGRERERGVDEINVIRSISCYFLEVVCFDELGASLDLIILSQISLALSPL